MKGHVTTKVALIFNGPMATMEVEQAFRASVGTSKTGHTVHDLVSDFARLGVAHIAHQLGHLTQVRSAAGGAGC